MKYKCKIKPDGTLEFLGFPPPALKLPAPAHRRRFSEITPVHPVLYAAFRMLRWMFGERGSVSEWTRNWKCMWECEVLIGPAKGTMLKHRDRSWLIQVEEHIWKTKGTNER